MSRTTTVSVTIKALEIIDNGNKTFTIVLPGQPFSPEEHALMEKMFPNLLEKAYDLQNQEALLQSLATVGDTMKPAQDTSKIKKVDPRPYN